MERRFQTGTVISAVGHLGVVLWVLVGDWLFAADVPPETITMTASTITSAEFDALQAAATATPSEDPAPVKPEPRPEPKKQRAPEGTGCCTTLTAKGMTLHGQASTLPNMQVIGTVRP